MCKVYIFNFQFSRLADLFGLSTFYRPKKDREIEGEGGVLLRANKPKKRNFVSFVIFKTFQAYFCVVTQQTSPRKTAPPRARATRMSG